MVNSRSRVNNPVFSKEFSNNIENMNNLVYFKEPIERELAPLS